MQPATRANSHQSALLVVSERQVYKLAAEGRLPCFRIGDSVRFDPSTLAAWLRQRMGPMSVDEMGRARRIRRA